MEQGLSLLTLGVPDLAEARRFYVEGLGWQPTLDLPEVVFLQVAPGVLLSLFDAVSLADDAQVPAAAAGLTSSFSLAHLVASPEDVAEVIATAEAAGATVVKPAQRAFWGGTHGYFADPAGFLWEVAHNPGLSVAADGTVTIAEVDAG
jgi:catechol 2,3-dioxygenase-like lactoylglutathione lyase family enzyme